MVGGPWGSGVGVSQTPVVKLNQDYEYGVFSDAPVGWGGTLYEG